MACDVIQQVPVPIHLMNLNMNDMTGGSMTNLRDIPDTELHAVNGGDWVDTTWGVMLSTAFMAGFVGSGGLLGVAIGAGALLLLEDVSFPG